MQPADHYLNAQLMNSTCTEWSRKNCTKLNALSFCNHMQ